jgi:hypothetical protein
MVRSVRSFQRQRLAENYEEYIRTVLFSKTENYEEYIRTVLFSKTENYEEYICTVLLSKIENYLHFVRESGMVWCVM